MDTSLGLIAEMLRRRGHAAYVLGDEARRFGRVRMLSQDSAIDESALYVASEAPNAAPCALALPVRPEASATHPCLVIEDAGDAFGVFNAIAQVRDELEDISAHMEELAWSEGGLKAIVTELTRITGNPAYVVDSGFKAMAVADEPDMEEASVNWMHAARYGYLSYDVVAGLIQSHELEEMEVSDTTTIVNSQFFRAPFANNNLKHAGKVQGHLFVVQMYKLITPGEIELIDLCAPYVLRALLADPAFQMHSGPLYEHFINDWLDDALNDATYIRRQLRALEIDPDAHFVVAAIWQTVSDEAWKTRLAWLLEDRQGCRAVAREDHIVAVFQLKSPDEKESLMRRLKSICKSQKCQATVSDVQEGSVHVPRAYWQARETQRIGKVMGLSGDVASYGDVAAYQPYLNFASVEELDAFCHPVAIGLRDYDRTHAVQLLPTLSAFLKNDRDVQKTAAELFVHRNTLTYRINRILELFPLDLDDFNTRHRLLESILIIENYEGIATHLQALQ